MNLAPVVKLFSQTLLVLTFLSLSAHLRASDLSPDTIFTTTFKSPDQPPQITAVNNRLAVSVVQASYLIFDLSKVDLKKVKKATLQTYLVLDPLNCQVPRDVTVKVLESPAGKSLLAQGSLQTGQTFQPTYQDADAVTTVDGSQASRYWNWDVTDLLKDQPTGNPIVVLALTRTEEGAKGAPLRFTGKDPTVDSGRASQGQPALLHFDL